MEKIKKVASIILFIVILFLLLLIFFLKKGDNNNDLVLPDWSILVNTWSYSWNHLWIDLKDILNKENYEKVWIDPTKYPTFTDFLKDLSTYENIWINPITEKFVIWIDSGSWSISYLPFDLKNNIPNDLNNEVDKNLAILDVYNAYKKGQIYWWKDSAYWQKILMEDDFYHPQTSQLQRIFDFEVNVDNYMEQLEALDHISSERNELLSYLYDLKGDYDKAEENRKKQCKIDTSCKEKYTTLTVFWNVKDVSWKPISWVKIELLNDPSISTLSKEDWTYEYKFSANDFSHLRFKTSKDWYSDAFWTLQINLYDYPRDEYSAKVDFVVYTPNQKVSINDTNYNSFIKGWVYYLIEADNSKYYIPINWLYYENETPYKGHNIDVYMYQFTKWTNMQSLLENDTFDPVYWYVWNIMKTFWMPYIQFFDSDTWKELFIKSSNPMILQNQIYHMKELYENYDKIYWAVTKEDMEFLYNYSQQHDWYPIDFDFLTQNNFLRWPARWTLDRKRWVWENVWQRLLNKDWLVELPFYSIKDN